MTPQLATTETPFFLVYGGDPNLLLHQLLEPMQWFLSDPDSGHQDLESQCLALAVAKKTLDENWFKNAKNNCTPPNFKVCDRVFFKNKWPGKSDPRWRAGYRIVCIECNGHYLSIETQATGKMRPCNVNNIVHEPPVKLWNFNTTLAELKNL